MTNNSNDSADIGTGNTNSADTTVSRIKIIIKADLPCAKQPNGYLGASYAVDGGGERELTSGELYLGVGILTIADVAAVMQGYADLTVLDEGGDTCFDSPVIGIRKFASDFEQYVLLEGPLTTADILERTSDALTFERRRTGDGDININISLNLPSEEYPDGYVCASTYYAGGGGNDLTDGGYGLRTCEEALEGAIAVLEGYRNLYNKKTIKDRMLFSPISSEGNDDAYIDFPQTSFDIVVKADLPTAEQPKGFLDATVKTVDTSYSIASGDFTFGVAKCLLGDIQAVMHGHYNKPDLMDDAEALFKSPIIGAPEYTPDFEIAKHVFEQLGAKGIGEQAMTSMEVKRVRTSAPDIEIHVHIDLTKTYRHPSGFIFADVIRLDDLVSLTDGTFDIKTSCMMLEDIVAILEGYEDSYDKATGVVRMTTTPLSKISATQKYESKVLEFKSIDRGTSGEEGYV